MDELSDFDEVNEDLKEILKFDFSPEQIGKIERALKIALENNQATIYRP